MKFRNLLGNTQAVFVLTATMACCILGGGGLVAAAILVWWIMNNLVTIGIGLLFIAIPVLLMVVAGVLVKRYLWKGGKK